MGHPGPAPHLARRRAAQHRRAAGRHDEVAHIEEAHHEHALHAQPREAMPKLRQTLAGISSPEHQDAVRRTGEFGEDVLVRHLIGLDTARSGVAVAHEFTPGMQLTFCERHAAAARADLGTHIHDGV